MKMLLRFSVLLFLSASMAPFGRAQTVATNDRVRVEVSIDADREEKDLKRTTVDKVLQHNTLQISLSGKARAKDERVIHWTAYGRDLKDNDVRVVKSGKIAVALDASGKQSVKSEPISTTYVPEHGVVKGGNRKNGGRAHEVDGTGTKFVGYRIEVLDGKTVVGEAGETPAGAPKK